MKLASIETIHSIVTHPNADALLKAKVLGWNVVIKKGEYQENDPVVFIFPDVIVDKTNPEFSFMESRKWKVWQARFRGEPSAGLVMPLSILKSYISADDSIDNYKNQIGLDVGILIKCEKYEKPIDINTNGNAAGSFPSHLVRKTDEDNLRSNPKVIEEFKGKTVIITQKADGSSGSVIFNNREDPEKQFKVCSRNLEVKEGENAFWHVANKYNLRDKLTTLNKNIAIQGEVVGPKMNGNRLGLSALDFYVFNIKDLDTGSYYNDDQIKEFCNNLKLKSVKFVSEFFWDETITVEKLQEIADSQTYPNGAKAEGIVIRSKEVVWSNVLDKELSVKLINQNYKD